MQSISPVLYSGLHGIAVDICVAHAPSILGTRLLQGVCRFSDRRRPAPHAILAPTLGQRVHEGRTEMQHANVELPQMPSTEPAEAGTPEERWLEMLEDRPEWTPQNGPLLVVSPHPDDEVLAAGGLIHSWAAAGREVTIVSVTDGEAAFPS